MPVGGRILHYWWLRAEVLAGLAHVPGREWHSLRKSFATALKGAPLRDLMELGGWTDSRTLLTAYVKPDTARMRRVLGERQAVVGA